MDKRIFSILQNVETVLRPIQTPTRVQSGLNPLALEMDIQIVAHHLYKMWIFLRTKKGNVMKYTTFCRGINWDYLASLKKI